MKELKNYFKSKEFIIGMLMIFGIAIYLGIEDFKLYPYSSYDAFDFWNHIMQNNYLLYFSSLLIPFVAIYSFHAKVKGSFIKNSLLRQGYNKFILKELFMSYVKAYLPFLILSLTVFIIGVIFYPSPLSRTTIHHYFVTQLAPLNPYLALGIIHITTFLYVIIIVNLSYIILSFFKNYKLSVILTFVIINIYSPVYQYIISGIMEKFPNSSLLQEMENNIIIYDYYFSHTFSLNLNIPIYIIMFTFPLYLRYRKKEKVIRYFE